jgi:hypothetical protein
LSAIFEDQIAMPANSLMNIQFPSEIYVDQTVFYQARLFSEKNSIAQDLAGMFLYLITCFFIFLLV